MNVEDDSESMRLALGTLIRHRLIVFAIWLGIAISACVYAWVATPVYRAEVLLAPASDEKRGGLLEMAEQFGGLAGLAGLNLGSGKEAIAIETLKSRRFVEHFVLEENLLPILFHRQWNEKAKHWLGDAESAPRPIDGAKYFLRRVLTVSEDADNGFVRLRIEWTDRHLATKWANDLANRLNQEMRRQAIADANRSLEFLDAELRNASELAVREAIFRLVESQMKNRMLANSREEFAFKIVDPAFLSGEREFVRPKRLIIAVVAVVGGAIAAAVLVLMWRALINLWRTSAVG